MSFHGKETDTARRFILDFNEVKGTETCRCAERSRWPRQHHPRRRRGRHDHRRQPDGCALGDRGDDTILGGAGADWLDGGAGIDTAFHAVTVYLRAGRGYGGDAAGDRRTGVGNVFAGGGADRITGSDGANVIWPMPATTRSTAGAAGTCCRAASGRTGSPAARGWTSSGPASATRRPRRGARHLRLPRLEGEPCAAADRIMDFDSTSTAAQNDLIDLGAIDANPQLTGDQAFALLEVFARHPRQMPSRERLCELAHGRPLAPGGAWTSASRACAGRGRPRPPAPPADPAGGGLCV